MPRLYAAHKYPQHLSNNNMRFKLVIEYDGTAYHGWQIQKHQRTVQGDMLTAIEQVFRTKEVELYAAGRTDAGVHALAQVAHLEVETRLSPEQVMEQLNQQLPNSINILHATKAAPRFHARHDAKARSYIYQISKRRTAFGKKQVWWLGEQLDLDAMQAVADMFVGFHDYQSFADNSPEETSTKVDMRAVEIYDLDDLLIFRFVGSHFLWKMVRRMVGVMVGVGRGQLTIEQVDTFLKTVTREPAKFTAPSAGLFLEEVYYAEDEIPETLNRFLNI
jgi:tRNA pseudouridine38-40 synthase